jgi:hypothetical protein
MESLSANILQLCYSYTTISVPFALFWTCKQLRAVSRNHCLEYSQDTNKNTQVIDNALDSNSVEYYLYICQELKDDIDSETICEQAALHGALNILKWMRENNCPWDEYTCTNAAEGGHLELLQWAYINGWQMA